MWEGTEVGCRRGSAKVSHAPDRSKDMYPICAWQKRSFLS